MTTLVCVLSEVYRNSQQPSHTLQLYFSLDAYTNITTTVPLVRFHTHPAQNLVMLLDLLRYCSWYITKFCLLTNIFIAMSVLAAV
jgi:hypothetical protein